MTGIQGVLAASVPASKSGWISLPSFVFGIPSGDGDRVEEMVRYFTSSMLKLHGIATATVFAEAKSEVQFVALCRVDHEDGVISFRSFAPDPDIVTFVTAQVPPAVAAQHTHALLENFAMPVRQSCVLPLGGWAPVVVAYSPNTRSVLLTNLNQIRTPEQFQNPWTCMTTSGFLNFLGTFLLKYQTDDTQTVVEVSDIEALLGEGLDPWIRWLHHFMETGTAFESNRVFVRQDEPEQYDYKYG
jgi:hypothetical protein